MTIESFIPSLWEGRLLANLNDAHVYKECCNTDYEGKIKGQGSSVKINSIGRITVTAHSRNTDITAAETLDIAGQWLLIDKAYHFNFQVDDIDAVQMKASVMDEAMKESAWGFADQVDTSLATIISAGVASANVLTAATVGNGAGEKSAYDVLVQLDLLLTENNTPEAGRWAVVPPWYEAMLRTDERFVSFGTDANRAQLRGAPIGMVSNLTIRKSNNVPSGTDVLAGYKGAVTYAEQIMKVQTYDPQLRFADAVKGLIVFGHKVIRPSNLAKIVSTRGTF